MTLEGLSRSLTPPPSMRTRTSFPSPAQPLLPLLFLAASLHLRNPSKRPHRPMARPPPIPLQDQLHLWESVHLRCQHGGAANNKWGLVLKTDEETGRQQGIDVQQSGNVVWKGDRRDSRNSYRSSEDSKMANEKEREGRLTRRWSKGLRKLIP